MKKLKARYIGRRLEGDVVVHAFEHGKDILFFKIAKWVELGALYEIHKTETGHQMARRPEKLGEVEATKEELQKWELEEIKIRNFVKRKRASKKFQTIDEVKSVINRLRPIVGEMSYTEKREFLELMIDELDRDARKERDEMFSKRFRIAVRNLKRRAKR